MASLRTKLAVSTTHVADTTISVGIEVFAGVDSERPAPNCSGKAITWDLMVSELPHPTCSPLTRHVP